MAFVGLTHQGEVDLVGVLEVALGEDVAAVDLEDAAEDLELLSVLERVIALGDQRVYFNVLGVDVILFVGLAGLVQRELLGKLLPLEHDREVIPTAVRVLHLADFYRVVGQIIVHNVGNLTENVEFQHLEKFTNKKTQVGRTFRSFSRNCFCEVTRPPPSLCSMKSFIMWSRWGTYLVRVFCSKLSFRAVSLMGCGIPKFFVKLRKEKKIIHIFEGK